MKKLLLHIVPLTLVIVSCSSLNENHRMKKCLEQARMELSIVTFDSLERASHLAQAHTMYKSLEGTTFNDIDMSARTGLYLRFNDYDGALNYLSSVDNANIRKEALFVKLCKYSSLGFCNRDSVNIIGHIILAECEQQYQSTKDTKCLEEWNNLYFLLSSNGDSLINERAAAAKKGDYAYLKPWFEKASQEHLSARIPLDKWE